MKTALPCYVPVLCLLMVLALAGRAWADKTQEILGRWEFLEAKHGSTILKTAQGETNPVFEFRQDGTFSEGARSGTYRLLTDTRLRLTYLENGKADSREFEVRITGNSLVKKHVDRAKFAPEEKYMRAK